MIHPATDVAVHLTQAMANIFATMLHATILLALGAFVALSIALLLSRRP